MVENATIVSYNPPMTAGEPQTIFTDNEKNSIKEKMAIAFLHAVNSTVDYSIQENHKDFDSLGFDFMMASKTVGSKRTVVSGANAIYVQLKGVAESSTSMFKEDATHITYRLVDDLLQFGLSMYLIIVVLPDDEKIVNWRVMSNKDVLLNARGYYIRVEQRLSKGMIKIPKTQQLNPETYRALFDIASKEVKL